MKDESQKAEARRRKVEAEEAEDAFALLEFSGYQGQELGQEDQ